MAAKRISLLFFLLVVCVSTQAQQIMSFEDFMTLVKENHPISKQANLEIEKGEAKLLSAKGGFDPQLFTNIGQKYFKNDQYYSLINSGLKIPTWFGLSAEGGVEQNNGVNLNPERKTPSNGLVYAGLSLSVGQGLFIDKRRADLRKAQIYENITVQERRSILNKLLLSASKAYWDWFKSYQLVRIYEEGLNLAQERFQGIKESVIAGDKPPIDTVEALIQVQSRSLELQEAKREFFNQTGWLNVYLWSPDGAPYELEETVVPTPIKEIEATLFNDSIQNQLSTMIQQHPVMLKNQLKIRQLEIERRWKIEQLKPVLNIKYNAINEPINQDLIAGYSMNNYNWGLQFYMPILLRKGRGELKMTNIKLRDQLLQLDLEQEQLTFNVKAAINDWQSYSLQLETINNNVENLNLLLNGEKRKFEIGESSLFLVNSRESKYIKGLIDQAKIVTLNQKSLIEISYRLGTLGD